jgi:hypothetical protein
VRGRVPVLPVLTAILLAIVPAMGGGPLLWPAVQIDDRGQVRLEGRIMAWPEDLLPVGLHVQDRPPGGLTSQEVLGVAESAAAAWTALSGCHLALQVNGLTELGDGQYGGGGLDGINLIAFTDPDAPGTSPGGFIATTRLFVLEEEAVGPIDLNGDGTDEVPAGVPLPAGAILDADILFNPYYTPWETFTTEPADGDPRWDLEGILVHELGHLAGLAHSLVDGATMFPFIDSEDRESALDLRTPDPDDEAWASWLYPEGPPGHPPFSHGEGPHSRVDPGDTPFAASFGTLRARVRSPVTWHHLAGIPPPPGRPPAPGMVGEPIAGAHVTARRLADGLEVGGYTGPAVVIDRDGDGTGETARAQGGEARLPGLPPGTYTLILEDVDGFPVPEGSVGLQAVWGRAARGGRLVLEEWLDAAEAAVEAVQGDPLHLDVLAGHTYHAPPFRANDHRRVLDIIDGPYLGVPGCPLFCLPTEGDEWVAVRFPRERLRQAARGKAHRIRAASVVLSHALGGNGGEPTQNPVLPGLFLVREDPHTGLPNLDDPVARAGAFVGQDSDETPVPLWPVTGQNRRETRRNRQALRVGGKGPDLWLAARLPGGSHNVAPGFDVANDEPDGSAFDRSLFSTDGGLTWDRIPPGLERYDLGCDVAFGLVLVPRRKTPARPAW